MILGIVIGIAFMILIVLAFAVGYGFADLKNKPSETEEE